MTDVCGLELDHDIAERAKAYRDICESVNYVWCNRAFVMVCDRPSFISRNDAGQLHNDQRKAIEYKDGWGLYVLDGVVLEESLWTRIVSQTMTLDEIVAIPDADHRAVALKFNKDAIIKAGAELIDEHPQHGELFKITGKAINGLLEERELYFMRMTCPTGRTFVECAEPSMVREFIKHPHPVYSPVTRCQAAAFGVPVEVYGQLQVVNEG